VDLNKYLGGVEQVFVRGAIAAKKKGGRVGGGLTAKKRKPESSGTNRSSAGVTTVSPQSVGNSASSLRKGVQTSKPVLVRKNLRQAETTTQGKFDQTKRSSVELVLPVLSVP
jgi:hypothetical protein